MGFRDSGTTKAIGNGQYPILSVPVSSYYAFVFMQKALVTTSGQTNVPSPPQFYVGASTATVTTFVPPILDLLGYFN